MQISVQNFNPQNYDTVWNIHALLKCNRSFDLSLQAWKHHIVPTKPFIKSILLRHLIISGRNLLEMNTFGYWSMSVGMLCSLMKNIGIILDQFPTSTLSHYSLHSIGKSWKVYLQNTPEFNFFHSHPTALIYALWQSRFHSEVKLKSLWSFVSLHRIWPPVTALGPHLTFFPLPHSAPATHTHPCCSSNAQATLPQAYGFCRSVSL